MMKFVLKILLSAVAVYLLAVLLPGVHIESYQSALIVALVLGVLNAIVRPVLVFLTFPITIASLGLFLLVINGAVVLLSDVVVSGFTVNGWFWAIGFSIILSIVQPILHSVLEKDSD